MQRDVLDDNPRGALPYLDDYVNRPLLPSEQAQLVEEATWLVLR